MSSIPSDSSWRGCAANFAQPVGDEDVVAAHDLVESVSRFNCRTRNPPLSAIVYRTSDRNQDVLHHVFRWDITPHEHVFQNGFRARRQQDTPDNIYFDLNHYVHHGGRPLDSTRPAKHVFISTTINPNWRPIPALQPGQEFQVYRYEIYAPGGIWVTETLCNLYRYPAQDEVCFVSGIVPQYIRSAQVFIATREAGSRYVRWRRADNRIIINEDFNPESHPYKLLNIQRPVFDYLENGTYMPLNIIVSGPLLPTSKLDRGRENDATTWYAGDVANVTNYINAAFRSSSENEAYIFMENEYVLLNYAPGSKNDWIISGPLLICDGFPSLIGTIFGEYGIHCAFDTDGNKAFIFSGNLCALIEYAPGTVNDKILFGPMTITAMFPFFKGTVFENGIDAAFRSSTIYEAYLFKGDQYALINYDSKNLYWGSNISQGFRVLKDTIFASGIDAAFASHITNEAYLFKGDSYVRLHFTPRSSNDYIFGSVAQIFTSWRGIGSILPRKNRGLDVHDHHN